MWLQQVAWGETVFCKHASPARSVKQTLWMVLLEIMGGGIFRHLIAQALSAGITSLKNPNKFLCNVKLMGSLLRQTKILAMHLAPPLMIPLAILVVAGSI